MLQSTWFNSERWAVIPLARRSGESSSSFCHYSQLSDPVTVPHPYEICVLIYNRDNNATNLESPFDVDSEKLKSLLRYPIQPYSQSKYVVKRLTVCAQCS